MYSKSRSWFKKIEYPLVGLSPMDGVTDHAFRNVTKFYGNPDIVMTEFTNTIGMVKGSYRIYYDFLYNESQRPIIAQVYGNNPEYFRYAAVIVCQMGFDGIDINMGCPSKNVVSNGSGAALIENRILALQIINAVKDGIKDYCNGRSIQDIPYLSRDLKDKIMKNHVKNAFIKTERLPIPVSIKTRVGYYKPVTKEWVRFLDDQGLEVISIHGRTLKQMYKGKSDWSEIAIAKKAASVTPIIGNGDIKSLEDAYYKIKSTNVDGVLIGRGALGNPWVFSNKETFKKAVVKSDRSLINIYKPNLEDIKIAALDHAKCFSEYKQGRFIEMRKHLIWYFKGFDNAKILRKKLCQVDSYEQLENILNDFSFQGSIEKVT